jgi:hypothetical protein
MEDMKLFLCKEGTGANSERVKRMGYRYPWFPLLWIVCTLLVISNLDPYGFYGTSLNHLNQHLFFNTMNTNIAIVCMAILNSYIFRGVNQLLQGFSEGDFDGQERVLEIIVTNKFILLYVSVGAITLNLLGFILSFAEESNRFVAISSAGGMLGVGGFAFCTVTAADYILRVIQGVYIDTQIMLKRIKDITQKVGLLVCIGFTFNIIDHAAGLGLMFYTQDTGNTGDLGIICPVYTDIDTNNTISDWYPTDHATGAGLIIIALTAAIYLSWWESFCCCNEVAV